MARQLKKSQKIRVILNGVVLYTKVGAVYDMFGGIGQKEAVLDAIEKIATSDVKITGFSASTYGCQVQVDLI